MLTGDDNVNTFYSLLLFCFQGLTVYYIVSMCKMYSILKSLDEEKNESFKREYEK